MRRSGTAGRLSGVPQPAQVDLGRSDAVAAAALRAVERLVGAPDQRLRGFRRLARGGDPDRDGDRSEEHTSELQSLMRISYAVFCLKKKKNAQPKTKQNIRTERRQPEH